MDFASTICFPVVAIVDEEVSDFAEGFKQYSIVEQHGGGDDGGMMSSGNWRVFCGGLFVFCNGVLCCFCVEYDSFLFLFCVHFFLRARYRV